MKLIGFIKEYNNVKNAVSLENALFVQNDSFQKNKEKVIEYLKQGELLLAWMGYFFDYHTREPIAPDSYFTDGVWVWPSYFPYYLEKYPNMYVDDSFLDYLISKDFNFKLNKEFIKNKNIYENQFAALL